MTIELFLDTVARLGALGFALIVIFAGARGVWVWGWLYRQERDEKEEWKRLALQGTDMADAATKVALRSRG
jgi:hypothetical protein